MTRLKIDKEIIKEIVNITRIDYEMQEGEINIEDVEAIIEDLLSEIHRLEEKYNDLEKELEENYQRVSIDYGMSYKDFL